MKTTKIMLAFIGTFILTTLFFGTIGYLLNELTFKQTMQESTLWLGMIIIGWLPALIVAIDLDDRECK